MNAAVKTMTKSDLTPMKWICFTMSRPRYGGTTAFRTAAARKTPVLPRLRVAPSAFRPILSATRNSTPLPPSLPTADRVSPIDCIRRPSVANWRIDG